MSVRSFLNLAAAAALALTLPLAGCDKKAEGGEAPAAKAEGGDKKAEGGEKGPELDSAGRVAVGSANRNLDTADEKVKEGEGSAVQGWTYCKASWSAVSRVKDSAAPEAKKVVERYQTVCAQALKNVADLVTKDAANPSCLNAAGVKKADVETLGDAAKADLERLEKACPGKIK